MQCVYIAKVACGEFRTEPERVRIPVEVRSHIKSSLLDRPLQNDFHFKQDCDNIKMRFLS